MDSNGSSIFYEHKVRGLSAFKNLLALKIIQLERIYEYFFFVQDLTVRFMEVHFFPGSEKNVSVLTRCPLYGGDSM